MAEGWQITFFEGKSPPVDEGEFSFPARGNTESLEVELDNLELQEFSFDKNPSPETESISLERFQENEFHDRINSNELIGTSISDNNDNVDGEGPQAEEQNKEGGNTGESVSLKDRDINAFFNNLETPRNCHIQHSQSEKYLFSDNGNLQLQELQNSDNRFLFQNGLAGGTQTNRSRRHYGELMNVVCLNGVAEPEGYLTSERDGSVSIKDLPEFSGNLRVLPTDNDPRFFYLIATSGYNVCLMSTKYENRCLAFDGKRVFLKAIKEERSLTRDPHIQFRIMYS